MSSSSKDSPEHKNLRRSHPGSSSSYGTETTESRRFIEDRLGQETIVPEPPPLRRQRLQGEERYERLQVMMQSSRPPQSTKTPAKSTSSSSSSRKGKVDRAAPLFGEGGSWDPQTILEGLATLSQEEKEQTEQEIAARCASLSVLAAAIIAGPDVLDQGFTRLRKHKGLAPNDAQWIEELKGQAPQAEGLFFADLLGLADILLENFGQINYRPAGGSRSHLQRMAALFSCKVSGKFSAQDPLPFPEVRFLVLASPDEEPPDHWILQGAAPQRVYLYDPWPLHGPALDYYDPAAPPPAVQQLLDRLL